ATSTGLPGKLGRGPLVIDPLTPTTLFVGTIEGCNFARCSGSVFRSTDGGDTWSAAAPLPCGNTAVNALAVNPNIPTTFYAAPVGGRSCPIFKTTDAGATWNAAGLANHNDVFALAIDPVRPSTIYAGTNVGVFRSADAGATGNPLNTGLTDMNVRAI